MFVYFTYLASFPGNFVSGHYQEGMFCSYFLYLRISSVCNLPCALSFLIVFAIEFYYTKRTLVGLGHKRRKPYSINLSRQRRKGKGKADCQPESDCTSLCMISSVHGAVPFLLLILICPQPVAFSSSSCIEFPKFYNLKVVS